MVSVRCGIVVRGLSRDPWENVVSGFKPLLRGEMGGRRGISILCLDWYARNCSGMRVRYGVDKRDRGKWLLGGLWRAGTAATCETK